MLYRKLLNYLKFIFFVLFKPKKFNYFVSIGQGCLTSKILEDKKLRLFSSPFDYCQNYNIEYSIRELCSEFKNFFNKENLELCHSSEENDFYINNHNKIIFNHIFPAKQPLDESYPKAAETITRRTNRLLNILKNGKINDSIFGGGGLKVLLVYIERPIDKEQLVNTNINATQEIIKKYEETLNKIYPNTKINILYLKHNEKLGSKEIVYKGDNYFEINNTPTSNELNLLWCGNYHIVRKIIKNYKLKK